MKNGLSTIIASLIMVLLVIVMVGVVWGITKGIIDKNADTSCFGNYGKVTLNNDYTCYTPVGGLYDVRFSVNVGDVDMDGVVVTLIGVWGDKSFSIMKGEGEIISGLKNYDETTSIKSPDKNAGLTYVATGVQKVDSIRIAPIINGKQCEVSNSINEIGDCKGSVT